MLRFLRAGVAGGASAASTDDTQGLPAELCDAEVAAAEAAISHTPPTELGEAATRELTSAVPESSIPAAADDDPERPTIRLSGPKSQR